MRRKAPAKEVRNQVFGLARRLFATQETLKARVGLLRIGKNLVSLQSRAVNLDDDQT